MQHLPPLSLATTVVRSDGFIDAEIDNEVVALNIETGTCYGLNRVGSRIWGFLAAPTQINEICARLVAEYNVESSECATQVLDLLEQLRAEGLITTHEEQ